MQIQFTWTTSSGITAVDVAGKLSQKLGICLMPDRYNDRLELLSFEIPGLSDVVIIRDDHGMYCAFVNKVRAELMSLGLHPEIYIDGCGILEYATGCERRERKLGAVIRAAAELMYQTRRWFKDKRLADIRHFLIDGLLKVT